MAAVGRSPSDADFHPHLDRIVIPVTTNGSYLSSMPPMQLNTQGSRNKWDGTQLAGYVAWEIGS